MTQANSVHSTPRKPAPKIKPTALANVFDDASRNEALARAFVSLEPGICDLDRMARLCLYLSDGGDETQEFLTICLERSEEMAAEFRKQYYAVYPGRRHSASADNTARE